MTTNIKKRYGLLFYVQYYCFKIGLTYLYTQAAVFNNNVFLILQRFQYSVLFQLTFVSSSSSSSRCSGKSSDSGSGSSPTVSTTPPTMSAICAFKCPTISTCNQLNLTEALVERNLNWKGIQQVSGIFTRNLN